MSGIRIEAVGSVTPGTATGAQNGAVSTEPAPAGRELSTGDDHLVAPSAPAVAEAALPTLVPPKIRNPLSPYGIDRAKMQIRPARRTLRGLGFPGDRTNPEESSRRALRFYAVPLFGKRLAAQEMEVVEVKHGLASSHTRYQQVEGGIPVYGAYASVHQGRDGTVQSIHSEFVTGLRGVAASQPRLSDDEARARALGAVGVGTAVATPEARLVWYPRDGQQARLAYEVRFASYEGPGDYHVLIDAESGSVLSLENRATHKRGRGRVFVPNPVQKRGSTTGLVDNNDKPSTPLRQQMQEVTLRGLADGSDLLVGEFVDLATLNSPTKPDVDARSSDGSFLYDRNDPRFEQVLVYHTVDSIQRYFHRLGFDDDVGERNGIRDRATRANAHWDDADNSFYIPSQDTLHFGDGGVDDAEDGDIVAHEYGHAVQHDQNELFFGGETRAMGEGFGDYLAASFFYGDGEPNHQNSHAAAVGEWDATSYSREDPPNLRRVDGDKHYPEDLTGEEHDDGEIWSRVLWDIRGALGGEDADRLILEHHFALPARATFADAALELIQADENLYGGRHRAALLRIFAERGIKVG